MTKTVHLGIYDALADWEVGHAIANINTPVWHDGGWQVTTVAETAESVITMGGVRLHPAMTVADLRPEDCKMLILPGAVSWDHGYNKVFAALARSFLELGVPVAAICGATYGLAAQGVLDDRAHTSSAVEYLERAASYHGRQRYLEEPSVLDGDLITAGPTHPVEFARHIFAQLGLMSPEVCEAWYGLFSTGEPRFFGQLMAARQAAGAL
jgi:putative intracellular protease/amidase